MKNWKKASIGALCVVSLLAGCGTQGGDTNNNDKNADEPKEISLEQVRADNIPEKLLEDHDTVTVSIQGTDQDSKETYTAKVRKGKWIEEVVGNAAAGRGVVAARI